jgi:hypothetical protein
LLDRAQGKIKAPKLLSMDQEAWRSFKTVFTQVAQSNGWLKLTGDPNAKPVDVAIDRKGRLALSTCFQGSTATHLSRYGPGKYTNLTDMITAIDAHLIPASATDYSQQLNYEALKKEGEDLLKWHGRLHNLFARANPGAIGDDDPRLKRKYVTGLRSSALLGAVISSESYRTWTYQDLLGNSQQKGAALDSQDSKSSTNKGSHLLGTINLMSASTEPIDRVAALEHQFKSFASNQNCWNCLQPGHMKYQCPQPKR